MHFCQIFVSDNLFFTIIGDLLPKASVSIFHGAVWHFDVNYIWLQVRFRNLFFIFVEKKRWLPMRNLEPEFLRYALRYALR